jgi:signal transduction histidine kinase
MQDVVSAEQLRRLLAAVVAVGSELEVPVVLRRLVEVAVDLVGARFGALGVLDETRTYLEEFITVGLTAEQEARIGALPRGHGLLGVIIVDPKPLRLDDMTHHAERYGFPPNHPVMRSFLGVPISVRGQVFGNLYLCDKTEGPFTDSDEEVVVALAAAAGAAIDNARLHAQVGESARVEDRDRIARDLHDTVIQRLYAVGLTLQGASARARREPEIEARIQDAIDEVDGAIRDIRSTIFELTPRRGTGGLKRRVLELCADIAPALGFSPEARFDGPVDLAVAPEVADHAVAVVREALSNVARHAHASKVSVDLVVEGQPLRLTLLVADDGVGLAGGGEPTATAGDSGDWARGGMGLTNLEERAAELGGDLEVGGRPGGGTQLRWTVPVDGGS